MVYLFLGRGLQAGGFNESFRHELSQGDDDPDVSTPMPRLLGNLVGRGVGRKSSPGPTPEWKLREGRAWPQVSKPQSPSLLPTRTALVCRYCCGGLTRVSQTKSEPLGRRLCGEARGIKCVFHWGLITFHFPHHYFFFFQIFVQLTLKRFPFARFPPPHPLFLCVIVVWFWFFVCFCFRSWAVNTLAPSICQILSKALFTY